MSTNPKKDNTRYSQVTEMKTDAAIAPASGEFMAVQHHQKLCFCNLSRTRQRYKNVTTESAMNIR
ncbi:hypothetical protein O3S81_01955 [Agrobacterium sp. SOY23]|uniref:hypothetical protein n=1 Tax=Agrobacterium sp. SOY23 TaxID=3014555 RepID=UPI001B038790|nr:hypothetical protein [Agrobacterium sp. SOY23]MBO9656546.1 hypothetical protein [Agrobacterium tumefaciens]MCZ4428457.1 hypothetical protein [Agrobacterium sp. SOY23]